MNIETIKMDPRIARIHYADYRKRCRLNREKRAAALHAKAEELGTEYQRVRVERTALEKEDEQLLKAYRALYRGQQILDLPKTIAGGGLDERKLPRFAVVRADAERCKLFLGHNEALFCPGNPWSRPWRSAQRSTCLAFSRGMPAELTDSGWRDRNQYPSEVVALVPSVPPQLRPNDLSQYFILWEAEWQAKAPVDPLLLSRVNDTMFAIVAQWDLTPLEQRVLEGRL